MKKLLLSGLGLAFGITSFVNAQTPVQYLPHIKTSEYKAYPMTKKDMSGKEIPTGPVVRALGPLSNPVVASSNGRVLGVTTYDLQSNAAVDNRFVKSADGSMSATWTYSEDGSLAAPDRGTGYVFHNGTTWGAAPTARLETERVGWPSIGHTAAGEVNIAHNTQSGVLTQVTRATRGTGSWTQTNISVLDIIWNRMQTGGPDGNSVHMVGVTAPTALGGTPFQGQDGALVYYRSLDGGATYDITDFVIPHFDASNFVGVGGDSYAIAVRGNTVAIVLFDSWADMIVVKSTDNGTTWSKHTVIDFPVDLYEPDAFMIDLDNDGVADTLTSNDGAGAIMIDDNDMVHVSYGLMNVLDADLTDGNTSFFPGTNGLMYWNESMGEYMDQGTTDDLWNRTNAIMIAGALDLNGNGTLDVVDANSIPLYFTSLAGFPNMSLGDDGDVYVSYSVHMETLDNTAQNYRHVNVVKSSDGGCTWTAPVDITPNDDFAECVFASLTPDTDDSLRVIYQEDFEPGLAVRGDEDPFDNNEIVYVSVPVTTFDAQPAAVCNAQVGGEVEFCAGDSTMLTASCGIGYLWSTGESTESIYATAHQAYMVTITTDCGDMTETITTVAPSSAPAITLAADNMEACPSDANDVWVTAVTGASYAWSTGDSTNLISVTGTGTFAVTVTNCGGSSVDSLTIASPGAPTVSISGTTQLCSGGSVVLSATPQPGATYLWSTGDSTASATVSATGFVTLTISNCGGSTSDSVEVVSTPVPNATILALGATEFCEGTGSTGLQANGGVTYMWSSGSSSNLINLSTAAESGDYYVIAFNACGDPDTSASQTVTIYAPPATPTISYDGTTFQSSSATGNQWYVNGVAQNGETSQSFAPYWQNVSNQNVTVVVTDANGCESSISSAVVNVDEMMNFTQGVSVYPNPNEGRFIVHFDGVEDASYRISVNNILGEEVFASQQFIGGSFDANLNLSNLNKGVYLLNVSNGVQSITERIIIK